MLLLLPLLAIAAATAFAQNTTGYAAGLVTVLRDNGYTELLTSLNQIGSTPEGVQLFNDLQNGSHTLFAPTNGALAGVNSSITSNATLATNLIAYHVLDGSFTNSTVSFAPNHTIARTALKGKEFVNIGGDRGQALVLYQNNGTGVEVDAPFQKWQGRPINISTEGLVYYENLTIIGISEAINLPPTLGAFAAQNASAVAVAMNSLGMIEPVESLTGITFFLPTNEAVAKLPPDALTTLNETDRKIVLQNHFTSNDVLYSTNIGKSAASYSGEPLKFAKNGTGFTVTSGNVTAGVIHADIIVTNGVVHLIDTVLLKTVDNLEVALSVISVGATASITTDPGVGPTSV